jgi:hypothetical protein
VATWTPPKRDSPDGAVLKQKAKSLVVDANVARCSGGPDATYPTSTRCRDFLNAVLTICHRVVVAPALSEEWRRHRSRFFRAWRVSMTARRKIVVVDVPENPNLRERIRGFAGSDRGTEGMLKDCHLIEAALATDRVVISLDETARAYFAGVAGHIGELRSVAWVNPDRVDEELIAWLEGGAEAEPRQRLGFWPGDV